MQGCQGARAGVEGGSGFREGGGWGAGGQSGVEERGGRGMWTFGAPGAAGGRCEGAETIRRYSVTCHAIELQGQLQ